MVQVLASWSGGKDSCLSYYKAISAGLEVSHLVNIINEDAVHSCTHGLPASVLRAQAEAMELPMVQLSTSGACYEADFKALLLRLRAEGVRGGVFGNGDVERQWIDRVCEEVEMTAVLPLEGMSKDRILSEFIGLGFKAIVINVRADVFSPEWLGRPLDQAFVDHWEEMKRQKNISRSAEAGAYHTLVLDGPIFKKRLELISTRAGRHDGNWYLEVEEATVRDRDTSLTDCGTGHII